MLREFKTILISSLCVISSVAYAADSAANYIGIDFKTRSMQGRNLNFNMMQKVLPKSYSSILVYAAHRFANDVGLGIGWEESKVEKRSYVFGTGEQFMQSVALGGNSTAIRTRIESLHLDLNGYFNITNKWELLGQLGIACMRVAMNATFYATGYTLNMNPSRNFKVVPTIGFGTQYFFIRNFGARLLLNWEGTNMYHMRITNNIGVRKDLRPFRQSWSAAIGLVAKF